MILNTDNIVKYLNRKKVSHIQVGEKFLVYPQDLNPRLHCELVMGDVLVNWNHFDYDPKTRTIIEVNN